MGGGAVILVVDDQLIEARKAQDALVAAGYRVPAIVTQMTELERTLAEVRPDLVLLDIEVGEKESGLELSARIPREVPFVFVSAHSDPMTLELAQANGAAGFVVKPFLAAQLEAAVRMALGRAPSAQRGAVETRRLRAELESLSAREREVVDHLRQHKRVPAIARALFISPHTVRNHLKKVFAKLNVRSQQELLDLLGNDRSR